MHPRRYFATCARGLEEILVSELRQLKAQDIAAGRGGAHFAGDQALLYQANLWLRTAVRVLMPVLEFHVASPDELYQAVRGLDWSKYMTVEHTLAVDCNANKSPITHSHYAALKTKDAICDQFMDRVGQRPSVDLEEPMIGLNLHIHGEKGILSLDSSGQSLHKRGYRPIQTRAPLNEALAAALILATGWKGDTPFVDPMCGSGTLAIEATWLARSRPPGLTRRRFGFQGWLDFDVKLWTELRDEARRGMHKEWHGVVAGSDQRRDVVEMARANARAAGVGHLIQFEVQSLADFAPPKGQPGTILCNPPYGERIGTEADLRSVYKLMGEIFRERCSGWQTWVFTGNPRLAECIGLPVRQEKAFYNGKIPCMLLQFDARKGQSQSADG
jgi:putative N6-adenine-specific DNA methylase